MDDISPSNTPVLGDCWVLPPLPESLRAALEAWLGETGESDGWKLRRASVSHFLMFEAGR